jgi:hypothetical protein
LDLENTIPEIIEYEKIFISSTTDSKLNKKLNILISSASKKISLVNAMKKAATKFNKSARIIAGDSSADALSFYIADDFWQMPYTNDNNFYNFAKKEIANFRNFSIYIYTRQMLIYVILKILSVNFIYKFFFFSIIKFAYKKNVKFLLQIFYPILRFKYQKFPSYYFTKMNRFSKNMVYLQLANSNLRKVNHSSRKEKNTSYMQLFQEAKIPEINLFRINDFNFQNYLDFPIVVKDKKKLINYLLNKKIDTRVIHYKNCAKIFGDKKLYANSDVLENSLLCLPNHYKISKIYMEFIVERIKFFYANNK